MQTYAASTTPDAQVRTQIETSYEATVNVDPIVALYQAAFGRVPDTSGLAANYKTYINGYNLTSLAQSFLNSSEGVAKFGANVQVTAGFVASLYTQALNRSAGSSEISYWTSTGKSAAQVLAEISNSQEAQNKEAAQIVTYLDSAATAALSGGSPNTGTLYSQVASSSTANGQSLVFTSTNGDNLQGSSGNDTFTGVSTGQNVAGDTIQTGDVVTGNGGVDTLVYQGSTGAIAVPTISGVSVVNLTNKTGAITANFANTGVSLVTVQNATANGDAITLKAGQVAGLDNVKVTSGGGTETFAFGNSSTSASLAVANGTTVTTGSVAVTGTNIATLNVLSAGPTANTISTLTNDGSAARALSISGPAGLTLGLGTGITNLTTIDATANGAGVKLIATETNLTSAKFGAGNDTFLTGDSYVTNAATLTAAVDGGAGLNYIGANNASLSSLLATGNKVTNFQVLEVQNAFNSSNNGAQTFDLSKIAGLSSLQFDGLVTANANGTQTYNNLQAGGSIYFGGGVTTGTNTDLTFNLASGQTNATETVFLGQFTGANLAGGNGNTDTIKVFQLQNVASLVVNNRDIAGANGAGVTAFNGVNDTALTSVTLQSTGTDASGAQTKAAALVLGTGSVTTGFSSTNISSIDATGYNANVDASGMAVNLSASGATIKGGIGDLYAVGGGGADTITSGTGGGIFNGGNGGADTIVLSATATTTSTNASAASVALNQNNATVNVLDVVQAGGTLPTGGNGHSAVASAISVTGFHLGTSAALSDVVAFNGTVTSPASFTGAGVESIAAQVTNSSIGQSPSSGITVSVNNSGIASVSGATGTAAIQALQNYLDKAVLPGQTSPGVNGGLTNQVAAIVVNGDTYLVHNGAQNNTTDDLIVKLVGITAETQISTTQYGSTTIHIA